MPARGNACATDANHNTTYINANSANGYAAAYIHSPNCYSNSDANSANGYTAAYIHSPNCHSNSDANSLADYDHDSGCYAHQHSNAHCHSNQHAGCDSRPQSSFS